MASKLYQNTLILSPTGLLDKLLQTAPEQTGHCSRCKGHIATACSIHNRQQSQQSTAQSIDPRPEGSETATFNGNDQCDSDSEESTEYWGIVGTVRLQRGAGSLGISFIGGCDTSLGCVLIQKIMPGGLAARDDRLRAGDVILQVNKRDLTRATHSVAKQALSSASTPHCEIAIYRGDCAKGVNTDGSYSAAFLADQRRRALGTNGMRPMLLRICIGPGSGDSRLGVKLVCRRRPPFGLFVHSLLPGSPAHSDGRLRPGDRVLELNGLDTSGRCGHPDGWDASQIGQLTVAVIALLVLRSENCSPEQANPGRPTSESNSVQSGHEI